jgi:hypothetical protein
MPYVNTNAATSRNIAEGGLTHYVFFFDRA